MTPLQYCEENNVTLAGLQFNADRLGLSLESYIKAKLPTRDDMNKCAKLIRKYGQTRSTCGIIREQFGKQLSNALIIECRKHWVKFVDYSGQVHYPVKGGVAVYWIEWDHDYVMSRVVFSGQLAELLEGELNGFFEWQA